MVAGPRCTRFSCERPSVPRTRAWPPAGGPPCAAVLRPGIARMASSTPAAAGSDSSASAAGWAADASDWRWAPGSRDRCTPGRAQVGRVTPRLLNRGPATRPVFDRVLAGLPDGRALVIGQPVPCAAAHHDRLELGEDGIGGQIGGVPVVEVVQHRSRARTRPRTGSRLRSAGATCSTDSPWTGCAPRAVKSAADCGLSTIRTRRPVEGRRRGERPVRDHSPRLGRHQRHADQHPSRGGPRAPAAPPRRWPRPGTPSGW